MGSIGCFIIGVIVGAIFSPVIIAFIKKIRKKGTAVVSD